MGEDEFDKGFDTTKWQGHYVYGADDTQVRDTAMWNREQVSFTERTSFGGVCQVPIYLIISVGVNEQVYDNGYLPASMIVDYVKCYRYI